MKNLRSLFGIAIVVAALYAGWRILPVYLSNYELQEVMDDSSRDAAVNYQLTDQQIRADVARQARKLDIPLTPEQIQIQRGATGVLGGDVMVWADYTVHVDLPFYPLDLHFEPASKNKRERM